MDKLKDLLQRARNNKVISVILQVGIWIIAIPMMILALVVMQYFQHFLSWLLYLVEVFVGTKIWLPIGKLFVAAWGFITSIF